MDTPPPQEVDPKLFAFWLRFWRWTVASLQIVGGLFGLYDVMFEPLLSPSRVFFLLTFFLFAASVWGGILLALNRRSGVIVSLIIQTLQVVQIATAGLVYSFLCGFHLVLGLNMENGPEVGFNFYFPVRFLISTDASSAAQGIRYTGVNVVAVLAIICLLYVRSSHSQSLLPTSESKPPLEDAWPPAPKT